MLELAHRLKACLDTDRCQVLRRIPLVQAVAFVVASEPDPSVLVLVEAALPEVPEEQAVLQRT